MYKILLVVLSIFVSPILVFAETSINLDEYPKYELALWNKENIALREILLPNGDFRSCGESLFIDGNPRGTTDESLVLIGIADANGFAERFVRLNHQRVHIDIVAMPRKPYAVEVPIPTPSGRIRREYFLYFSASDFNAVRQCMLMRVNAKRVKS